MFHHLWIFIPFYTHSVQILYPSMVYHHDIRFNMRVSIYTYICKTTYHTSHPISPIHHCYAALPLLGGADKDLVLWSRDRRCQPGGGCNGGCAVPHRDQGPMGRVVGWEVKTMLASLFWEFLFFWGEETKTIFGWKNMGILVGIMWRLEVLFGHPCGNRRNCV